MKRSALAILLSLFLGCLIYQLLLYYQAYLAIVKLDSLIVWLVIMTCVFIAGFAVLAAAAPLSKPKYHRSPPAQAWRLPTTQTQKENDLCRQLIRLLNGDQQTAQWLLYLSQQQHPGKSVVWQLEQVIQELNHHRSTQSTTPLPQPPIHQPRQQPAPPPQPHTLPLSKEEAFLYRQLVSLLQGDAAKANRLFHGSLENNPGKSLEWNLEKLIHDLARDRGGKPTSQPYEYDYRAYRDC